MKFSLLTFILSLFCCGCIFNASAQKAARKKADKQTQEWRYEIETVAKKADKSYELKISSFSKKPVVAMEQCKKNAVHTTVFKGIPAAQDGRTPGIKALFPSSTLTPEQEKFFAGFFETGGDFMRFVTETNAGLNETIKLGKEYKISVRVVVNVPALRRYLEDAGMIRALNTGF
ncbi:hypothetical protein [uncultured Alistipes sp.]|nr:hypothetical protein [uncultured Alistipes sp.]